MKNLLKIVSAVFKYVFKCDDANRTVGVLSQGGILMPICCLELLSI